MRCFVLIFGLLLFAIACEMTSDSDQGPVIPSGLYKGANMPHGVESVQLQADSTRNLVGSGLPEPVLCFVTNLNPTTPKRTDCYKMVEWISETPYQPAHAKFRTQLFGTWFWVPEQNDRLNYQQGPAGADFYPD